MVHYGFGMNEKRFAKGRKSLCGQLKDGDKVIPQPGTDWSLAQLMFDGSTEADCESCLELSTEAALYSSTFLLCPDCIGLGVRSERMGAPAGADAVGGNFCQKCDQTGLVLAGFGGRWPQPGDARWKT